MPGSFKCCKYNSEQVRQVPGCMGACISAAGLGGAKKETIQMVVSARKGMSDVNVRDQGNAFRQLFIMGKAVGWKYQDILKELTYKWGDRQGN